MLFLIPIALVSAILLIVYKYLTWHFDYWNKRGVKGPKPKILTGNFPKSFFGKFNFIQELHDVYMKYKSKDRFIGVFICRKPQFFILDPTLAVQILTTHFSSFRTNEAAKWTTPDIDRLRFMSPTVTTGSSWTESRLDIGPASSLARLRSFYPVMQRTASKLSDFLKTQNNDVDMKETSRKFTVQLMADYIWGINTDTFQKNDGVDVTTKYMIEQTLKCIRYYGQTAAWPWLRKLLPERFIPKSADLFFTQLTKDASKLRSENPINRVDILDYLFYLQNKKHLSETRLVGYVIAFLVGGVGTVFNSIAHCLLLLAMNADVQAKLRKEILENLNEIGTLNFSSLNDLPYLDQCVHESIRLFPPVSIFSKLCTSPIELENSDGSKVKLQPGDTVCFSAYSFYHDEEYFEKPEEFIPERFDPDFGGIQKYCKTGVFLPFGTGPRKCIGAKLALMELKIAVAEVVHKFEISVAPSSKSNNRIDPRSFLLTLEGEIHLNFKLLT